MRTAHSAAQPALMEPIEPRTLLAATHYRIEVGGNALTEATGKSWQADRGFTGGIAVAVTSNITNTTHDRLYRARPTGDFSYALGLLNGTSRVKMLFADPIS